MREALSSKTFISEQLELFRLKQLYTTDKPFHNYDEIKR